MKLIKIDESLTIVGDFITSVGVTSEDNQPTVYVTYVGSRDRQNVKTFLCRGGWTSYTAAGLMSHPSPEEQAVIAASYEYARAQAGELAARIRKEMSDATL